MMKTATALERPVAEEDRIATLESDMKHVKASLVSLDTRVIVLDTKIDAVRSELHAFKLEVAKEFGALRAELIEKFGSLKVWVLLTAAGTLGTLITMILNIVALMHGWKP